MKIGIVTYWTTEDNYGQLLQCYALQKWLRSSGHEACVIKYNPKKKREWIHKLSPLFLLRYIKYKYKEWNQKEDCSRDFVSFRKYIAWSAKEYDGFKQLSEEDWSDYDAFICGSDQIWSEKDYEQLQVYFLKFVPFQKKKISYAPSFGTDTLKFEYSQKLPYLIRDLDCISIREKSGTEIIKNAGRKATLVCDPTILLNAKDFYSEFGLENKEASTANKAFCYFINWETDCDENSIQSYCQARGLKCNLFATKGYKSILPLYQYQNPIAWLNELKSSSVTLVNSFHGLVFSIIFHKPFAVYLLKGSNRCMNSRVLSLLNLIGLTDRIVSNENSIDSIFKRNINWDQVDECIRQLRTQSELFLTNALTPATPPKKYHNICFITNGCVHHYYGGLDRVTECLRDQFERDGNTVYYLSFKNRGMYDERRQSFFPDSTNINSKSNQEYLTDFISNNKIDILINQEGNVNICVDFVRIKDVKIITCLHFNPNYIDDNYFLKKFNKNKILKLPFKIAIINKIFLTYLQTKLVKNYQQNLEWCDKFVLLSSKFIPEMNSLIGNVENMSKLEWINNPLPNKAFEVDSQSKDRIILFVGRLDNNFKRIDELIDDVSDIISNNPSWKFVICGDGPDKMALEDYARKKNSKIEFTGYCDPSDWYSKSSIIVLKSSRAEGWGMVLTEAMAQGVVPVVAGTYSSLTDIIETEIDGIITTDNKMCFRNAISGLINDTRRLEIMRKAAMRKAKKFHIHNIAKEWYRLFK